MLHWFRKPTPAAPNPGVPQDAPDDAPGDAPCAVDPAVAASDAHKARGNACFADRRLDEAAACFREAIALHGANAAAHFNLGLVLREQNLPDAAADAFARALDADPGMADAAELAGAIRLQQGRLPEALSWLDRAVALAPGAAAAHADRGVALAGLGRADEAAAAFERSLALAPGDADIHNRLGTARAAGGGYARALESFEHALRLSPGHAEAQCNRATALGLLGRREEAAQAFGALHEAAPDFDHGIGLLLAARLRICDWRERDALVEETARRIGQGRRAINPFDWLAATDDPASQLACSRIHAADKFPAVAPMWRGERYTHGRIKVAYLSADLHDHATAHLMAGLFERHDAARFETIALSFGPDRRDAMRERLARSFSRFIDVRDKTDAQAAALLRALEVDIAVDLKGYTTDARCGIFAHRAAPVQVSYLGYPGTLGAGCLDYVIADGRIIPPDSEGWYTEKVVRLPHSYQVNDATRVIAPGTPTREQHGLPAEGFVFCCFNNNYKTTPQVFDAWMRLLRAVPGSVLWLLQDSEAAARNLRAEAARRGVDAARLVFAPRLPVDEHLARHALAGLFLDTVPCNAHTTTSDALWAGLPVLTLKGRSFAARVAASLLHAVGLPELVTHSLPEYEALALALATDPARLARLRARLAAQRRSAPLFDTDLFRRHLESAYEAMWRRQQAGLPPAAFDVG